MSIKYLSAIICIISLIFLCGCEGSKQYLVKNSSSNDVFNTIKQLCSSEGATPYYESTTEGVMKFKMNESVVVTTNNYFYGGSPFDNERGLTTDKIPFDSVITISQEGNDVSVKTWWGAALMTNVSNPYVKIYNKMKTNYEIVEQ